MKPNVGDLVRGKYRVERLIGDGGMGSVFEASHEALGTQVALKFLHPELARRPGLAARFAREARVAAAIQSPHVTRVTDVDATEDGTPFLVMELLRGQSLASVLEREQGGRLSLEESLDFTLQILAGLDAAHTRGVVHRDLKPDNVFVTPSPGGPLVKLFDFGIAKVRESKEFSRGLTHAGVMMGTPEYMAPEQLYSAAGVDHRADLYSLGVMLFEMLSGKLPAEGDNAARIVAQVQQGEARRLDRLLPDLPHGVVHAVHTALAPDPDQRFDSAASMRQALAPFALELSDAGQRAARASMTPAPAGGSLYPEPLGVERAGSSLQSIGALPDTVPPEPRGGSGGPVVTERLPAHPQRPSTVLTPATPHFAAGASAPLPPQPGVPIAFARRNKKSPLPWILASLAAVLGASIGVLAYQEQRTSEPSLPPAPNVQPPPVASPKADGPSSEPATANTTEPPALSTPATPPTTPAGRPSSTASKPPAQGTGGNSQTPGNESPPAPFGFPLPLPSQLPPLPSSLPPLPDSITSALPTSFPPIFQPANNDKNNQAHDPSED